MSAGLNFYDHISILTRNPPAMFYVQKWTQNLSCIFSDDGYECKDDDFIFEDFARLRLQGHDGDDTEA